jgi:hypothetical protein
VREAIKACPTPRGGERAGQPFTHTTCFKVLHHLDEATLVLHHRVDVM